MSLTVVLLLLVGVVLLIIAAVIFSLIGAWVKALFNGAAVPMSKLVALKLASIPYSLIVDARITAVRAGINVTADQIASHYQAGGNVVQTVQALIAAQKAGIPLPWIGRARSTWRPKARASRSWRRCALPSTRR